MLTLAREISVFNSHPKPMRMLLLTNMVYSLVLPVIELFIGAYIIRSSADFSLVIVFQLAQGAGIPLTFLMNAWLLRYFPIARLYSAGMILSGCAMGLMMLLTDLTLPGISAAGFIMGLSYGFFWANRVFLALTNTTNKNRNYYYGLETFLFTFSYILMPLVAGYFIASTQQLGWFGGDVDTAYHILTVMVILLTIAASVIAHRSDFKNPGPAPFLYLRFHRLWNKMLLMASFKGVAQGFVITAPVMLIMKLVGNEGSVGMIQSVGAGLSALLLYVLGRKAGPEHRITIFSLGLALFLLGAAVNMTLYSYAGALIFVGCQVFARPLLDLAYFPIQLGVTECVSGKEQRNPFTYIFTHEVGLFTGRLLGCGAFILIARSFGEDAALRYALVGVAFIQAFAVFIARSILKDKEWCEPDKADLDINVLKEPVEM